MKRDKLPSYSTQARDFLNAERQRPAAPLEAQRAVFDAVTAVSAAQIAASAGTVSTLALPKVVALCAVAATAGIGGTKYFTQAPPVQTVTVEKRVVDEAQLEALRKERDAARAELEALKNRLKEAPTVTPPVSTLEAEQRLLQQAQVALTQHDAPAALVALAQHERRFPRAQLAEEREALRVRALLLAGQKVEAKAAYVKFAKRFPHSAFVGKLAQAIESAVTP
jgi:hypothetical protein